MATVSSMVRRTGRRPILSICLLTAAALVAHAVSTSAFAAPAPRIDRHGSATSAATGGWLTQPPWSADAEPELRVPRASAAMVQTVAKTLTYAFEAVSLTAILRAITRSVFLPSHIKAQEKKEFDGRRFWTVINVINHAIYAILFVIRSLFYTGAGSHDRAFFYESYFLGYLCGPSFFLPTLLGWNNNAYHQPTVLKWVASINGGAGNAFPAWVNAVIGNPSAMFYYQIAEGIFHFMIVFGGLRSFFKKSWGKEGDADLKLFRWGLWLEIILMDISYVTAYSCLPGLSCPGHWGLTTIMMLIHHVNVLPDVVCAWYEWKASRDVVQKQPALQAA